MVVNAKTVAELREMTGAGMMDAKKALEETGGDLAKAAEALRKNGITKAAGKASRETKEGRVYAYVHASGKVGAMVEVLCETDFVARNDAFVELCKDLAMQVCAADPLYVRREQVSPEVVEKEKQMYREEMAAQTSAKGGSASGGKPTDLLEKIVEGKLNKYFSETCLLEQEFVKDETKTVEELVKEKIALLGENIQVNRFSRFQIG